ncbi:pseudouridine synthase [Vibrio profundum]|uniref:RluA family pseudouridine synthase n=1 Tax=Vibrio profundum TaxID=2910247 RepID=UPI003D13FC22
MPCLDSCFTPFSTSLSAYSLPERFTYPFFYHPHPLAELAVNQLQNRLLEHPRLQTHFLQEPQKSGKMFGVLVVKNSYGKLGYLSAFSGKIAEDSQIDGFVPPVFDTFESSNFYQVENQPINLINQELTELKDDPAIAPLKQQIKNEQQQAEYEVEQYRITTVDNRAQRKLRRQEGEKELGCEQYQQLLEQLSKESVFEKNQLKAIKGHWQTQVETLQAQLDQWNNRIQHLQSERKRLSNELQNKLFRQFRFLNKNQVERDLLDIFSETKHPTPPSGSGDCAAPKLLQYAFKNGFQPIALAEFWWGNSPKSEIRKHKHYYPACQSKCLPILTHMLDGMALDDNPLLDNPAQDIAFNVVYEDEAIVVIDKPSGLLSVPGKHITDSVFTRLQERYSNNEEDPIVVHRLDMATSGLLVFALTKRANKSLQKQFISRTVKKHYVAVVDGALSQNKGSISLPLRGDLYDRPRQLVCYEDGKPAHTDWELIETRNNRSKLRLYPVTGRTHQLRVHCAHPQGLNTPIVGDDLYGRNDQRLHLHAEQLEILHPYTKEKMCFTANPEF